MFPIMMFTILYPTVWIFLSLVFLFAPERKIKRNRFNKKPFISVIIPARNEEKVIQDIMVDCVNQTYKNLEILVVAHNCKDRTVQKAEQIAEKYSNIKVYDLKTPDFGKGIGLNFGLNNSKGSVIVSFDADSKVDKNYIENGLKYISAGYAAVQGRIIGKNVWHNLLTTSQHLENLIPMNILWGSKFAMGLNPGLGGTGVIVERRALDKIGGWRNILVEDLDLFMRLNSEGFKIAFAKDCLVKDEKVPHWSDLIRQRARWLAGRFHLLKSINFKILRYPLDLWQLLTPIYLISLFIFFLFGSTILFCNIISGKVLFLQSYIPLHVWYTLFLIMNCLFCLVLVKVEGLKKGLFYAAFLPVFFIFAYHWYVALLRSFKVKSWVDTKTMHGFG